jgi:predicted aspartyl protease
VHPYRSLENRPKAPYVTFELHSPNTPIFPPKQYSCVGLLDTGAERTYVPKILLAELQLKPVGVAELTLGISGNAHFCPYIVTIIIENYRFENIVVFGWERPTALVGRDILDSLHVCFDGINVCIQSRESIT